MQRASQGMLDRCWSLGQSQIQLNRSLQRPLEQLLVAQAQASQHIHPILLREGASGYSLFVATTKPGKQRQ